MATKSIPPRAERREHKSTHHGFELSDPYHWLRDPNYPKVEEPEILDYLKAENRYFEGRMAPLEPLIDTLFAELKGRQPEEDASVPYRRRGHMIQWRFAPGAQYRTWWRWPEDRPDEAVLLLDEPALAEGCEYFRLGALTLSPDGRYLAYATDIDGSERFTLRIRELATGTDLAEEIDGIGGAVVWAADSRTLLYTRLSEQWRPYVALRHTIGEQSPDGSEDIEIYREADDSFFVGVDLTQSDEYLLIATGDHITSEVRVLPAADPTAEPQLIAERRTGVEYDIEHQGDAWLVMTNDSERNFRLARAPLADPSPANWRTVTAGDKRRYLTGFLCLKDLIVIEERIDGLDQIRLRFTDGSERLIEFPEATYSAGLGTNAEYESDHLRLGYDSMVTPGTVYDYEIATGELVVRKVQEIPSGYDASRYACERRMIRARDGVEVPVSLVYRRDTPLDAQARLHVYAYGAYGSAIPPGFSTSRLSLLDRGFVYAIAHIRGGDDLGYHWYEAGKLAARENTFNDFVDVVHGLLGSGVSAPGRVTISGGSAGGELMGAVVNQAPELWGAVVAHVPFVDVLNTMLSADLPLTPMEWPEWGNPIEDQAAFELIRGYSPYDQLSAGEYPPMLVTAGLNDPRVTYWEPAKYVAKLRTLKTGDNPLLLKTNMGAGHGGKSGRFDSLRETAEEFAFLLAAMGVDEAEFGD
ncbi:MAG: S9 family peptidase [Pseudomonadota bacterium]